MAIVEGDPHIAARILIADDHEMVRKGIRSLLAPRHDFEVSEASDGREAVEKTIDLKPDLVILDVSMPLLDGFSVAREIRRVAPGTAILILTLEKTNTFAEVARRIGVSGYLTKDENGETLLRAIDAAIGEQSGKQPHCDSPSCSPVAISSQSWNARKHEASHASHIEAVRSPLLRVLFLHSRTAFIEHCLQELKDVQFQIKADVVLTSEQFAERLRSKHYDIVLAEYPTPKWQRTPTLDLLRRTDKHIPIIFVTDKMEREAVADHYERCCRLRGDGQPWPASHGDSSGSKGKQFALGAQSRRKKVTTFGGTLPRLIGELRIWNLPLRVGRPVCGCQPRAGDNAWLRIKSGPFGSEPCG